MKRRMVLMFALMAPILSSSARAQSDFMGAHSVLNRMLMPPGGSAMLNPRVAFCDDLEAFAGSSEKLSPDQAAHAWLALVRRGCDLDANDRDRGSRLAQEILKALPSPKSWPIIARNLAEAGSPERESSLQVLFDILNGNEVSAFDRLRAISSEDAKKVNWNSIKLALAIRMRNADAIEEAVKSDADAIHLNPPYGMRSGPTMQLPNLVPLLGTERAGKLLSYVLFTARAEMVNTSTPWGGSGSEKATFDLARKIAVAHVDRLAWPQWTLATGPTSGDLYTKLVRRFPKVTIGSAYDNPPSWSTMQGAAVSCFVNLYAAGQAERARSFAVANRQNLSMGWGSSGNESLLEGLRQSRKLAGFLRLLGELSRQYPDSPLAGLYLNFAKGNQPLSVTEHFLRALSNSKVHTYWTSSVISELQTTLLQQGKLAEAAKVLLAKGAPDGPFSTESGLLQALGVELHRPDLTRRGLDRNEAEFRGESLFRSSGDLDLLIKNGRGPAIEKVLIGDLKMARAGTSSPPAGQLAGLGLANFYYKVGRYADVVTMFEKFPGWQAPDVQFLDRFDSATAGMLANSLIHVGRRSDALRVVRRGAQMADATDATFEMLLLLDRSGALPFLQSLNRERPADYRLLKWQAVCLLNSHRLPEAETMIRRAIAVGSFDYRGCKDYSAYSTLASILRAQGRADEAKRLAPLALASEHQRKAVAYDELHMMQSAISEYRKAVALAPDDFHLLVNLGLDELRYGSADRGKSDIARAFNYVPVASEFDSVLRGDLLRDPVALPVVRDVLRAKAAGGTKSASVFEWLGIIDSSAGNLPGAIQNLHKAVALDPDCLRAWNALGGLAEWLPVDLRRQVSMALVRLKSQVSGYDEVEVTDYQAAWYARAARNHSSANGLRDVFTLGESRSILEKGVDQDYVSARMNQLRDRISWTPGAYIAQDPVIKAVASISFFR